MRTGVIVLFALACAGSFAVGHAWQAPPANRGEMKLLLGKQQLGVNTVAMAERTYPGNYASAEHSHESIEVLYVLSGEYQHVVNGRPQILGPGQVAFVKQGDKVQHKTGGAGAKVLMIWSPGDEGERLVEGFGQPPR